jgi:ATP-binding cassette subfamily F protein 2
MADRKRAWAEKKARLAEAQAERELMALGDNESKVKDQANAVAMGGGEEQIFEKKLSKEEKKAEAARKREEKRKAKLKAAGLEDTEGGGTEEVVDDEMKRANKVLENVISAKNNGGEDDVTRESNPLADQLASEGTICTFSASRKGVDARSRDVNVQNFTLQHLNNIMLDGTAIVLNHGNRYGLIGRNGCGKSTLMKALGARAVPIPAGIDTFHLKEEVEPSDTMTALDAVMSVDEERSRLEREVEDLNMAISALTDAAEKAGGTTSVGGGDGGGDDGELTMDEKQEILMDMLTSTYERLDDLDADTAETRARSILQGLGFTHDMQSKLTKDFSGGWRMRVSLARALFIQPTLLLLDEPTNHLDMEAVIWLEDYLSKWNKILLLISHSQDFLNNVCTHTIHFTHKQKLEYYDGNYDQFVKTKSELEENQMKQYAWEQDQMKSMKEYIARFGHGTSKNAKQAQSKQKVLDKMVRGGLTTKPEVEKPMNFKFPDPGHLPPPVLAFHDVSFGYPNCEPLYTSVNFGVDLDSRVALVGPNGAGKTTLVKLMSGELMPSQGDIRPHGHLKIGRFTQHFVDVLQLDKTPLEFFDTVYPGTPREEQRKYLGRFGISGKMQVQKMAELSDGQKSRVVFAKLGRDAPHILLLDEPTNHLDMESIDALAKAVNEFEGGLVLVSHDMRLISQVAKEIWICDHKTITMYQGDINNFKMDMRAQLHLEDDNKKAGKVKLKGDASVVKKADEKQKKMRGDASVAMTMEDNAKLSNDEAASSKIALDSILAPKPREAEINRDAFDIDDVRQSLASINDNKLNEAPKSTEITSDNVPPVRKAYVPPHLRNKV